MRRAVLLAVLVAALVAAPLFAAVGPSGGGLTLGLADSLYCALTGCTFSTASGSSAVTLSTGARIDLGGGASDYLDSDGTNAQTGGSLDVGGSLAVAGVVTATTGTGTLRLQGPGNNGAFCNTTGADCAGNHVLIGPNVAGSRLAATNAGAWSVTAALNQNITLSTSGTGTTVASALDVSGTLTVDEIFDSGSGSVSFNGTDINATSNDLEIKTTTAGNILLTPVGDVTITPGGGDAVVVGASTAAVTLEARATGAGAVANVGATVDQTQFALLDAVEATGDVRLRFTPGAGGSASIVTGDSSRVTVPDAVEMGDGTRLGSTGACDSTREGEIYYVTGPSSSAVCVCGKTGAASYAATLVVAINGGSC